MQSDAPTVDAYMKEVPDDRRPALEQIRALIHETHPGLKETMEYGMPSYSRDGVIEVALANQVQNIALYVLKEGVMNAYRDRFSKSAMGKGCLRLRNPAKIDFDLIREILVASYESDEEPC